MSGCDKRLGELMVKVSNMLQVYFKMGERLCKMLGLGESLLEVLCEKSSKEVG